MPRVFSVVEFFPDDCGHRCGYCQSVEGSIANGMWAHVLHVEDYQSLIDSGWRRSGKYCYLPFMKKTCCPSYTIRCDALQFKPSKSQKKVMKRMRNYLMGRHVPEKDSGSDMTGGASVGTEENTRATQLAESAATDLPDNVPLTLSTDAAATVITNGDCHPLETCTKSSTNPVEPPGTTDGIVKMKKKELRRQRWLQNHPGRQLSSGPSPARSSLEQLLELPEECRHRLQLKLVAVNSDEFNLTKAESCAVYKKYQTIIHKEAEDKSTMESFERFLCSSPFKGEAPFGAFHQQYWLDNRLIAVGVLDILPNCVSSKYLFYDPNFSHLSLGTYASFRELELTRRLHETTPSIQHYYMGYYIHSCAKMRYKARIQPSWLLCPETHRWFPVEQCLSLLDTAPYSRLAPPDDEPDACSEPPVGAELKSVCVLHRGTPMSYGQYTLALPDCGDRDEVRLYLKLVGERVTLRTLLLR